MKKIFALLLVAVMLMGTLAACGGSGSGGGSDFAASDVGYDGSEVNIKFAHTSGAKLTEILNYHIGEFNKLYPNIHVEVSYYGAWGDINGLINTEIMGDNQPNVAYCYPDHVAMYNMALAAVPMDGLIASTAEVTRADGTTEIMGLTQEQIDDFVPTFYAEGKVYADGKMYTLPMSKSTEILFYNKTFFDENNLTPPTTWEEMKALCLKIREIDPNDKCTPLGYDSEDNWFITMCEQGGYGFTDVNGEGADHYLFNNDQCKAFVKELRSWYQNGLVTTKELNGGTYTSSLFCEADHSKPYIYMCIGSSGGASYQIPDGGEFEVGVAPIPQIDPQNPKAISQGPSLCILKGGKTTDQQVLASWLLTKYLCTNMAFQTDFSAESGYMPVIQSARTNELYAEWLSNANGYEYLPATGIILGLENAASSFTSPAFNGSSTARKQAGALLAKCMSEETSDVDALLEQAFKAAYDECVYHGN